MKRSVAVLATALKCAFHTEVYRKVVKGWHKRASEDKLKRVRTGDVDGDKGRLYKGANVPSHVDQRSILVIRHNTYPPFNVKSVSDMMNETLQTRIDRFVSELPLYPFSFPIPAFPSPPFFPCRLAHHPRHLFYCRVDAEQAVRDIFLLVAYDRPGEWREDSTRVVCDC